MKTKAMLKAFTMMDIMTGMVVMSIVIAMVFYLMSATNNQAFTYGEIRVQLNNYMLMKADLKRKTETANRIEEIPNGFRLISEIETISYLNLNSYLIRQSEKSLDTLYYPVSEVSLIADETEVLQPLGLNPLITGVKINLLFGKQILSCYLYKDYGLTEPINQQLVREF